MIRIFFGLLICLQAHATEYQLLVQSGEKQTRFSFTDTPGNASYTRSDDQGQKTLSLSDENMKYLDQRFLELKKFKSHQLEFCHENFVILSTTDESKPIVACALSKTEISRKMLGLANLLQMSAKLM